MTKPKFTLETLRTLRPELVGNEDTKIADMGLDSLEFLDLLLVIEDHLGHPLPERVYGPVSTVGELISIIQEGQPE